MHRHAIILTGCIVGLLAVISAAIVFFTLGGGDIPQAPSPFPHGSADGAPEWPSPAGGEGHNPPDPTMMSQKSALAISSAVRRLSNTQIPVNRRVREIQLLGWKDDHDARAILMAAGDASIHLRCQAIEALGQCHGPDVRAYLEEKLQDPDARVVCAAVRALAASAGTDGAPAIVNTMQGNREREDGHGPTVRTAAVAALQKLGSPNAIPALIQELGRSEEPGFDLEYGSAVLAALGAASNKEARRAIAAYADRLESRTPADPLLAPHLKEKIAEARAAAQDR